MTRNGLSRAWQFFNQGDGGAGAGGAGGDAGKGGGAAGAGGDAGKGAGGQGEGAGTGGEGDKGAAGQGDGKGGQGGAGSGSGKEGDAGKGGAQPPEKYELAIPDGAADFVSKEDLAYFEEVARASGWTNEEANAELTAHADRVKANVAKQTDRWLTETKADSEVGGDNLAATQTQVKAVLDRFLPESDPDGKALRTAMNASGYGNYRPLVKLLARIGKAMSEDKPGTGRASGGEKTAESLLYDHPTSKPA